ncbi:MAG: PLP-dependent transferase [Rhodothermales bacterium]|nr:PLP-dependent transferase [Rhodothermales bacterium]
MATGERLETLLATAGCEADGPSRDVTPPLHLSTTFERGPDGDYPGGYVYSREGNPTRALLERTLAKAEGGEACAAFASGMAACNALITAVCPGGHLLVPHDVYHGLRHVIETTWREWGLRVTAVDYSGDWEEAIQPDTRLVWIETPSNPLVQITDIEAVSVAARARGIPTAVDSTWNTPLITQPLALGATYVIHSATKYLGGHSDLLGGAVVGSGTAVESVYHVQKHGGAVMDPFSAWLVLRGMRSLPARLRVQCASAEAIARFLDAHAMVQRVHYPSLESHAGHAVAQRQMQMWGGMLSFEIDGGRSAALALTGKFRHFRRATSLGGTESLVEHRASVEPEPPTSPEGLLRISVGLEHVDDLLEDLGQALS